MPSELQIVRNGRLIHDKARLSWPEAQAYYHRGHTLLVRYAERSSGKFQALAEAFAQFFHAPVDIQVYLTPDQSQAFGWHYDLEEVFIIQVQGCAVHRGLDIPPRSGVGAASGVSRTTASGRLGGQAWALLTGQRGAATTTVMPSLDQWLT